MDQEAQYRESITSWNNMAEAYEKAFMHLDYYQQGYDAFIARVWESDANILEIGCGPGNIARYMLSQKPGWKWLGTDAAPAMVERASLNVPSAEFRTLNARDIGQLSDSFHGIVIGFCIPFLHPDDVQALFLSCADKLAPGGSIYVSFVPGDPSQSGYKTGTTGNRTFFHYHPESSVMAMLQTAGFGTLEGFASDYPARDGGTERHLALVGARAFESEV